MRALLSAVGTRGDVQPIVAVALRLRERGHDARLCVPPNFVEEVRARGFEAHPVGIEMRARPAGSAPVAIPDLISDQFDVLEKAVDGCDVVLGANAHQYAARSIAELRGKPYVTAVYAPFAIPSPEQWAENARAWNARALERVNHNRTKRGLAAVDDVLRLNLTDKPWMATDAVLGPAPGLFQTGAWILDDARPLPPELIRFLDAGAPPLYFGLGSMPASQDVARALVDAARAVGRRLIVSRGWADLSLTDDATDCFAVDDVNHPALFRRVAATVHHGGAGTTATAARAAVPQLVLPLFGDQFYWGSRVRALGLGTSLEGPRDRDTIAVALREVLQPNENPKLIAARLSNDGATNAARGLEALLS